METKLITVALEDKLWDLAENPMKMLKYRKSAMRLSSFYQKVTADLTHDDIDWLYVNAPQRHRVRVNPLYANLLFGTYRI